MEEEKMQGTIKSLNDISILKMLCGISKMLICLISTGEVAKQVYANIFKT